MNPEKPFLPMNPKEPSRPMKLFQPMKLWWKDRRVRVGVGVAVLLVALGALAWWMRPADPAAIDPAVEVEIPAPPEPISDEPTELRRVELYFPGEDGLLHGVARELPESPDPAVNVFRVVEALLAGPHGEFATGGADGQGGAEGHGDGDGDADGQGDTDGEGEPDGQVSGQDDTGEPPPLVPIELTDLAPADGLWPPLPAAVDIGRAYLMGDATVIVDLIVPEHAAPMSGTRAEILMLYSLVNTVLLNTEEAERLVLLWNGQQRSTFAGHFDTTRPLTPKSKLIAR